MNASRRKKIEQIIDDLTDLIEQEQTAFDNLPESIQESTRGQLSEQSLDLMEEAKDSLSGALNPINI